MEMSPAMFYLIVAVALIGAELVIMQFSVFWFLFFGLGALVAALAAWAVPELSWFVTTAIFLFSSLGITALLYPMLKKWQNQPAPIAGNDAIGQEVKVIEAISADSTGKVLWSGSDWPAQLAKGESDFAVGDSAKIKRLDGIRLIVGR